MKGLGPLLLAIGLLGCSALGLADNLDQRSCERCGELDEIEPTGDPCLAWQCNNLLDPMAGVCVIAVLDADGDGAPSPMCVMDATADCDDMNGDTRPGREEACDLIDNTCDGVIDEGALTLSRSDLVNAPGLAALSWTTTETGAVAVYGQSGNLVAAHLPSMMSATGADALMGPASNPDPRATAIAATGSDFGIAYSPGSGCSRIVLGTWSGSGSTLSMPMGHDVNGLPKSAGDCASGDTSQVGHPALASAADAQVLVAYLSDQGERTCGASSVDVSLVVAQRGSGGDFGDAGARAGPVVGQSVDAAPALVAIGGGYGYLLAFANSAGSIAMHRVEVDGSTLEVSVTREVYVQPCAGSSCGDVTLTVASVGADYEVALAFRDGECESSAAALRVLSVDPATATIEAIGELRQTDPMTSLQHPVAARRTGLDEWVLAWSSNAGAHRSISMQRFDPSGAPVGVPRELLETTGVFNQPLASVGMDGPLGLQVFAYDSDLDVLTRGAAACAPSD